MPLQNRVTPEGEIIATPQRGLMMGNRGGAFHLPDQVLGARRWASKQWIACVLEFKGRHRAAMMQPNRYTELFFLDEVTALAAGHRPCFECRRADAELFAGLWARSFGRRARAHAGEMDEVLQAERVGPDRAKVTFRCAARRHPHRRLHPLSRGRRAAAARISLSAITFWPGIPAATGPWC